MAFQQSNVQIVVRQAIMKYNAELKVLTTKSAEGGVVFRPQIKIYPRFYAYNTPEDFENIPINTLILQSAQIFTAQTSCLIDRSFRFQVIFHKNPPADLEYRLITEDMRFGLIPSSLPATLILGYVFNKSPSSEYFATDLLLR